MRGLAFAAAALALAALPAVPLAQAAPPQQAWVWSDPAGDGDLGALLDGLDRLGAARHVYGHLGMAAFRADAATARALAREAGGRLDANARLPLHLDESVPYIGADEAKAGLGAVRDGPTVLVVDTGVDSGHPDFSSANLVANVQPVRFGGLVVATQEDGAVVDAAGHGTHVAGIVVGSGQSLGAQDGLHGHYTGVYSVGRAASYQASSEEDGEEAQVEVVAALEAFDWTLDNRERLDIRVATNSWGEPGGFDPDSPINYATRRLYLAGVTVVFSAGNSGDEGPGTLNRYCLAPWVLCVAAGDLEGGRAAFSSYGSGDPGKPYEHPDLTAPGKAITAAKPAAKSPLAAIRLPGSEPPSRELYTDRSGTSMAAPHVAGAAALVQAANPALSPDQVMDILVATARPMDEPLAEAGAGYLDAGAAYRLALRTAGAREAFLDGVAVKYAGSASGDAHYAADPVSVGYGQVPVSSRALSAGPDRLWVATPVAVALLAAALACVAVGTRFRAA